MSEQFEQFKQDIASSFNWQYIKNAAIASAQESPDGEGLCFLGTVMALTPSGKYYTSWANSNVTDEEAELDEQWSEALGTVAEQYGLFVTSGEGDPCDIFVGISIDKDDESEE